MWHCLWLCLWHSMLFFRRKASRRVVCIVPYRRGACQPVSAEFRRHLPFSGAGGCPRVGGRIAPALQARRALAASCGGRAFFVACPAFSLLYRPLSPQPPSPAGKGETKVIFMQGASPLASPGLDGTRHWLCLWKTDSCDFEWNVGTRRGREPGLQKAATAVHLYGRSCKCRKRFSAGGAGGEAPGEINFESPPSPEGKGAGGWGQNQS